ncbi:MAG: cell division protein FtsB [Perlucidibaca sp.]
MTSTSSLGRLLLWLAAGIFLVQQLNLWFGEGGILDVHRLKSAVAAQQAENLRLRQRNQVLEAEVNDLKNGREAIEERARLDLGMIKDDETFYLVTGKALAGSATADGRAATPSVVGPAAAPAAAAPAGR